MSDDLLHSIVQLQVTSGPTELLRMHQQISPAAPRCLLLLQISPAAPGCLLLLQISPEASGCLLLQQISPAAPCCLLLFAGGNFSECSEAVSISNS